MANISGLLGTAGGYKGTGVDAPEDWVDSGRLNTADQGTQAQFNQQNNLLSALQAQNGLGNQTSVFNQLQGVANGTGPNPAQAQLAQSTAANTANQAALMAGQRGSSANTGLIARQAAMTGANNQQQAAGQAATLQAQQSLNAMGAMGSIANTQAANQVGQTNANMNAAQAYQNTLLTGNSNQNSIRSGLIQATAQQQASGMGSGMNGAGSAMSSFGGSSGGGATGGGAAAAAEGGKVDNLPKMASGGMMGGFMKLLMADGGGIAPEQTAFDGPSRFSQFTSGMQQVAPPPQQHWGDDQLANSGKFDKKQQPKKPGMTDAQAGDANEVGMEAPNDGGVPTGNAQAEDMFARGGKVPALVSPGEGYLSPEKVQAVKHGKADPMAIAEKIPGKPRVAGAKNSYANDTVPKTLEEGGIVLPRSVTQSKHPHWAAMKFVQAHMMANGGKVPKAPKKPKGK